MPRGLVSNETDPKRRPWRFQGFPLVRFSRLRSVIDGLEMKCFHANLVRPAYHETMAYADLRKRLRDDIKSYRSSLREAEGGCEERRSKLGACSLALNTMTLGVGGEMGKFFFGFLSSTVEFCPWRFKCRALNLLLDAIESFGVSTSFTSAYFRTFSLGGQNTDITRAVIVVHGILRDADEYFSTIISAARAVGELDHVVIIAPWFKSIDDKPSKGELYWKDRRWKYGDPADNSGSDQVGAYEVMDRLIERLRKRDSFPNLKTIVVTGHSGRRSVRGPLFGGQLRGYRCQWSGAQVCRRQPIELSLSQ